jgi:MFS family permease
MRTGRWWMLAITCLSVIVVNLDLTILNIALPDISASLHAGTGDLQWLLDAYSLVFAGVMLPAGMAGDRLGRKRLLLAGLAVFLAASVWCALSVSAGELIAVRALMGLGAGIVFPLSLAVVSAAFDDDERPKAIGILTAGIALGLPLGPVLGEDPIGAAVRLLPLMGGLLVGGGVVGAVVRAAGTRLTVAAGLAMLASGLVVLSLIHLATGYGVVAAGLTLCGLGTGASIGAAMNAVMAAAGGDEVGIGASVNSTLRNAAAAVAIAVLGSVLSTTYARDLRPALARLPAPDAAAARSSINQAVQLAGSLHSDALRAAAGTAFLHGMSSVMLICAALAVAAILTSLRYLPAVAR